MSVKTLSNKKVYNYLKEYLYERKRMWDFKNKFEYIRWFNDFESTNPPKLWELKGNLQGMYSNNFFKTWLIKYFCIENPYCFESPYPKQAQAIANYPEDVILYGGSAGGGKSSMILQCAHMFIEHPRYSSLIGRKTYSSLRKSGSLYQRLMDWAIQAKSKKLDIHINRADGVVTFPSGARIETGSFADEAHTTSFQGSQFQQIFLDEVTELGLKDFQFINSRRRRADKNDDLRLFTLCASNPSNNWVRDLFVDKKHPDYRDDYIFIPSRVEDNPSIDADQYHKSLSNLDRVKYEQLSEGNWFVSMGSGEYISEEELINVSIPNTNINAPTLDDLNEIPEAVFAGIDMAGEGDDKSCITIIAMYNGKPVIIHNKQWIGVDIEEKMLDYLNHIKERFGLHYITIESAVAGDAFYLDKFWEKNVFDPLIDEGILFRSVRPIKSKAERFSIPAKAMRESQLFIRKDFPDYNTFVDQALYITIDKAEMKKLPSPDVIDSMVLAYSTLSDVYGLNSAKISITNLTF
jgi:hypothetical protein